MSDHNYHYPMGVQLTAAKPGFVLNEPRRQALERAVRRYNAVSGAARNPKELTLEKFTDNGFIATLHSAAKLNTPGRGLKHLSRLVLEDAAFSGQLEGSRVFTTYPIVRGEDKDGGESGAVSPDEVSDAEFLKALVEYFFSPIPRDQKLYRSRKNAVSRMKAAAIEAGIVKIGKEKE